jgi:DNA-binding LacI/PurR family transcriptional regulator
MDNFQAGYLATKHLVELGHPSIAFISGHMSSSSINQRYQGYRQVLKKLSIAVLRRIFISWRFKNGDRVLDCAKVCDHIREMPSAVVVSNDLMALGFIDGIKESGFKIPDMLSVVSFDNITFAGLSDINLTTIDQHSKVMSEHAARMIQKRIKEPDALPERTVIDPELIIRGTTTRYNPYRLMI